MMSAAVAQKGCFFFTSKVSNKFKKKKMKKTSLLRTLLTDYTGPGINLQERNPSQ